VRGPAPRPTPRPSVAALRKGKCCPFFCGGFPGPLCARLDRKNRGNAARFFAAVSPGRFVLASTGKTREMLPVCLRQFPRDPFRDILY
jgi:hypothetical protein